MPQTDPSLYSLQTFSNILGGGMSSRLFQEAREKRGLCYSIYSFHAPYSDVGMFGLYAGTDAADTSELMRLIVEEIAKAADTISEAEIARSKAQMKAGLLMALESSGERIGATGAADDGMGPADPAPRSGAEGRGGDGRERTRGRARSNRAGQARDRGVGTGVRA